jgi:hypothetical protein
LYLASGSGRIKGLRALALKKIELARAKALIFYYMLSCPLAKASGNLKYWAKVNWRHHGQKPQMFIKPSLPLAKAMAI